MQTTIINRASAPLDGTEVYIGRGSRWGNPFVFGPYARSGRHLADGCLGAPRVTETAASREDAVERYRVLLLHQVFCGAVKVEELAALHGQRLACYCAPDPCHGDVLARAAAWAAAYLAGDLDTFPTKIKE
jgi:hypothetical protein